MIKLLILLCVFSQIKNIEPDKKWEIEIITRKTQTYRLLTKKEPVTFTVEGPTYLRVYTRIFWPDASKNDQIYKIILQENETDERILTFETKISESTKDKKGHSISRWRSFYINVPDGINRYKLIHWSSPLDTILLKFAYESPKRWVDVPATEYNSILEVIEEEKIVKYYELKKDKELLLKLNGPVKLKVVSRLNYDETLLGKQTYTILVEDNGKETDFPLKCYKSETITYKNRKEIVPSNGRNFYLNLDRGLHTLKFKLRGTVASSASLRFLIEER